jgi:PhnB protein
MQTDSGDRSFVPPGWRAVTPRIVVQDVRELLRFLQDVFDARAEFEEDRPTVVEIGDSKIMVSAVGIRGVAPAFLYVYVRDADAVFQKAVACGARVIEAPLDTPYGDRRCMVEDRWGNSWQIAMYRSSDGAT